MKKRILIFLFLAIYGVLQAQVSIGVRAGGNYSFAPNNLPPSTIGTTVLSSTEYGTSNWTAGLIGNFDFGKGFSLQAELLYTNLSRITESTFTSNNTRYYDKYKGTIRGIQLPVFARYDISLSEKLKLNFMLGAFAVHYHGAELAILESSSVPLQVLNKDGHDEWDYGASGGLGASYSLGIGKIGLDIRYDAGLRDFRNSAEYYYFIHNASVSLSYIYTLCGRK